jgi:hypothetical protein
MFLIQVFLKNGLEQLGVHATDKTPISGNIRGKYHCTIDLLFGWVGIGCRQLTVFILICKTD